MNCANLMTWQQVCHSERSVMLSVTGGYLKMPFFSYSRILKMRARKLTRLGWDDYTKRFVSLGLTLEFTQCLTYSYRESLSEARASSYRSTFLRRLGMPIGKIRQASLLSHPPTSNQQDYLLYVILDALCERSLEEGNPVQPRPTLKTPIFPFPPVVGIASCRYLIIFLLQTLHA